jgi:hypothetical protein
MEQPKSEIMSVAPVAAAANKTIYNKVNRIFII